MLEEWPCFLSARVGLENCNRNTGKLFVNMRDFWTLIYKCLCALDNWVCQVLLILFKSPTTVWFWTRVVACCLSNGNANRASSVMCPVSIVNGSNNPLLGVHGYFEFACCRRNKLLNLESTKHLSLCGLLLFAMCAGICLMNSFVIIIERQVCWVRITMDVHKCGSTNVQCDNIGNKIICMLSSCFERLRLKTKPVIANEIAVTSIAPLKFASHNQCFVFTLPSTLYSDHVKLNLIWSWQLNAKLIAVERIYQATLNWFSYMWSEYGLPEFIHMHLYLWRDELFQLL